MARSFERLPTQDASFILFENPSNPMNVGAVAICDLGPLALPGGGVDAGSIRRFVGSKLDELPHYRQRLAFTPIEGRPVWVDDVHFDLAYHVRHTALPHPGSEAQLRELVGRLLSQPLDRARPLWEIWIVEGLAGDRFALVVKTHHCMVDGVGGMAILTTLFRPTTDRTIEEPPEWVPQPVPSALELAAGAVAERLRTPLSAISGVVAALRDPAVARARIASSADAVVQGIREGFRVAVRTPFNRRTSASRRIEWCSLDLASVRALRRRLQGTVNDVVLTVVTGALRDLLKRHRTSLSGLDLRVVVPVNVRDEQSLHASGNHVSAWFLSLPVAVSDPLQRFERIRAETERLRSSRTAEGIALMARWLDWTGSMLVTLAGVRIAAGVHPYHLIVTNVAGPQAPLYLLGAPLRELYPQLPLFENEGLGVAVFSYLGRLGFSLIGDWALMPDLRPLARSIEHAFAELCEAAGVARPDEKPESDSVTGA